MKRAIVIAVCLAVCLTVMCGCWFDRRKTIIIPESQKYFFIPAGTPFKARAQKNGELVEVVLEWDAWVTSAGYLLDLQKRANRRALGIPD